MSNLPDEIMTRLSIAAEMRAAGATWAKIGEKLDRDAETCRRWPREYRKHWLKLFNEAEAVLIRDTGIEVRNSLRRLLQSKDEKIIARATAIMDRGIERQRVRDEKELVETPEQYDAETVAILNYCRGLTDEEAERHMDEEMEKYIRKKQEKAAAQETEMACRVTQGAA